MGYYLFKGFWLVTPRKIAYIYKTKQPGVSISETPGCFVKGIAPQKPTV